MPEQQTIPARHGVATFVPAGQVIKIVNTSGTQVIDTWAFALPAPDPRKSDGTTQQETKTDLKNKANDATQQETKKDPKRKKSELPSQEEAEKATQETLAKGEDGETPKKSGWSSYVPSVPSVPSLGFGGKKKEEDEGEGEGESEQTKNSRTWGEYFTAGKGFSSYIPKQATDTVSQFAAAHERDKNKSYIEQLQDFSRTPVGAAGYSGMAAVTGSGYAGSLYAGYQSWNSKNAANAPAMEFMSMMHSRASTLHLRPQVNDTLVTNLRDPILTVVEDSSPGIHDTLIAACDPQRYKGLGVSEWEQHGSCAENLVLALKELNEKAGLKGAKAVGADVTINSVPAPLNLFMNIPWDEEGDIGFKAPKSKKGDFVRLRAERDVVVVMSACPQDILDINNKKPTDGAFIVEDGEGTRAAIKRSYAPVKKTPQKKVSIQADQGDEKPALAKKKPAPPKVPPPKNPPPAKKPVAAPNGNGPQPVKKQPPAKKPTTASQAPVPARPMKKPVPSSASANTNGTGEVAERKKPKKIVRPQAA